jgi:MFS family permease
MEIEKKVTRPWTIKWAVGLLSFVFITGLIEGVLKHNVNLAFAAQISFILVLIFGIWRGNRWGRNLLFFILLLFLPLVVLLFGLMIQIPSKWDIEYTVGVFRILISIVATVFLFMKLSNEWFASMKGEQYHEQTRPSWNFQLTLIGISMGLGFLVLGVNTTVSFIPFGKEMMVNFSTYYSRFAVLLTFESLGFLIGVMAVVLPFGFIIGYWKQENIFFMTRLITMGAILPVLAFPVGKTFFLFSTFFFSKVLIVGTIAYIGLHFGKRTARYIDTLRVPIEIK